MCVSICCHRLFRRSPTNCRLLLKFLFLLTLSVFFLLLTLSFFPLKSLKYMEEFVHVYGSAARINRMSTMPGHVTAFPVYMVVFLIHVLAHDPNFPTADHHDANSYAQFFRLVLSYQLCLNTSSFTYYPFGPVHLFSACGHWLILITLMAPWTSLAKLAHT